MGGLSGGLVEEGAVLVAEALGVFQQRWLKPDAPGFSAPLPKG